MPTSASSPNGSALSLPPTQVLYNASAERVFDWLCPRLYRLDPDDPRWGCQTEHGVSMPDRLPLSGASLTHDALFLMTGPEGWQWRPAAT